MLPLSIVEDLNVPKGRSLDVGMRGIANAMPRSFLKLVTRLSVGALYQQLPFQPIEQIMP